MAKLDLRLVADFGLMLHRQIVVDELVLSRRQPLAVEQNHHQLHQLILVLRVHLDHLEQLQRTHLLRLVVVVRHHQMLEALQVQSEHVARRGLLMVLADPEHAHVQQIQKCVRLRLEEVIALRSQVFKPVELAELKGQREIFAVHCKRLLDLLFEAVAPDEFGGLVGKVEVVEARDLV